jgi:hypothetical protein
MTAPTLPLKRRAAWKKLQAHFKVIGSRHLRELFAEDPDRGEQLTLEAAGNLSRLLEEPHHAGHAPAAR